MKCLLLYLNGDTISFRITDDRPKAVDHNGCRYKLEKIYFADWTPLRDSGSKIVGFKLMPFMSDEYLKKYVLNARFIRFGKNVTVETGKYTYISILLKAVDPVTEDSSDRIEAAIFRNGKDDFIIGLDGFCDRDWQEMGFAIE